ncbi:MAG TPA: response regulator [Anaerolineales bacterium]|nr:response regulator [Anaerolineales bacterium]HNA88465.1 response regulator [Anaerolineales bacterium]HNB36204.1 response regulator [Anaerolineales bacterium]HNC07414.1 response regulator [Anaerolineales bacterium]
MATGDQILIVENDPDIADLIGRQSLKPLGYHVTVVGEAGSAIKFATQTPPDLIIANLNLPGLSGKDMLAAFNSRNVKSPVIIIAEKGQEHDAIQAFRLGAMDVIFWPLRDAEVVSIVERALRQTQETRERQKLDRQLKATNDELQRRLRDMTTILSIAKAVTSVSDQRVLFDRILESALQLGEADICWLMLREDKTNLYLLRAHRGLPEAWSKKMNQQVDDGISSLVALSGESLFMNGVPLQKFKVSSLGRSVGVIPIKIKTEVIGLLLVVRKNDREFARDAQTMLEAMADYASISMVNARLFRALEQSVENARTGEKHRHAALDSLRTAIQNEVQSALYPLNLVMTGTPGALNPEQKKALESVQTALQRLGRSSEKTIAPQK